jgi:hypothetical protein
MFCKSLPLPGLSLETAGRPSGRQAFGAVLFQPTPNLNILNFGKELQKMACLFLLYAKASFLHYYLHFQVLILNMIRGVESKTASIIEHKNEINNAENKYVKSRVISSYLICW